MLDRSLIGALMLVGATTFAAALVLIERRRACF
jgi:hypothetical protein